MCGVETRLSTTLSNIGREALRIVLPSWCVGCDRDLPWRDRVASCCGHCWRALPRITSAKCQSCALPLSNGGAPLAAAVLCVPCTANPSSLTWCEAWGEYRDGLERVLHAFKFEHHDFLDEPLAKLLQATLTVRGDLAFDAIVPIPMHRTQKRTRGYNQAELLAIALAARIEVPCQPALLTKTSARQRQSTLARSERVANVRGVFSASSDADGKSLLIVDDICTTGETLRSAAQALLDCGAARVCAISVAKAT
jgi:ComF family protein